MNDTEKRIARRLLELGAFKDKTHPDARQPDGRVGFLLKLHEHAPDAPLSPVYLNLRVPENPKPGPLTPGVVSEIAHEMAKTARDRGLRIDRVVGVPRAGDPFAEGLARALGLRGNCVMRLIKEEGAAGRRVARLAEGQVFERGDRALLVDDLITGADSKLEAIAALESAGLEVKDLAVVVDREQGGSAALHSRKVFVHAIFTLRGLMAFYFLERLISVDTYTEIGKYLDGGG